MDNSNGKVDSTFESSTLFHGNRLTGLLFNPSTQ
ncbi:hypothetical protein CCACVL1_05282 [Corchorus capsularis]|uniref:Uncharacterized protein n=1 Tax=Corchorus capsularis TaxID=210143 RepID=A0A1R3JLL3_COCAP|nr:hypothetical protein CCACVL1_05282 [Corchorus capsularis]